MEIKRCFIHWFSFVIFKTNKDLNTLFLVRKLERIKVKLIKTTCHLKFNEVCLCNRLLPTYTNIYIYIYIYI